MTTQMITCGPIASTMNTPHEAILCYLQALWFASHISDIFLKHSDAKSTIETYLACMCKALNLAAMLLEIQ